MASARDIFDECCVEVASSLASVGFTYQPSQHSAKRASGDLKFEIHFQSSFRNYLATKEGANRLRHVVSNLIPFGDLATFGKVSFIAHAIVRSKTLKVFRKSLPNGWTTDDIVTGAQIGNLQSPARWLEFNLANPFTRREKVREIRQLIDSVALPYFEVFNNPADVIARLLAGSIPWTWEPSALEYVCCFGSVEQGVQLLNRYIEEPSNRVNEYHESLVRYRSEGVPEAWESVLPSRLAKAALILGLDYS